MPQLATYNSFEKISTLAQGNYTAAFVYNTDNQRAQMTIAQNGTTILNRIYAGSSYMKETKGSATKEYTYIGGDAYSAPVAAITQNGTTNFFYLLRDYLGNITHVVNAQDLSKQEYSYDAWGRRRNPIDWSYNLTGQPALFADRGFTGHEYLAEFELYNMNGRMYDPVVGRFLSVDNYVQMPGYTQSFNRYSYCLNNPLKYNDLTGEKWKWPKFEYRYLIPFIGQLDYVMQTINDNTVKLRQNMTDAGIPDFGVGVNVNGAGNVNVNGNIMGHEVLNTQNIDRSGPSVTATYKMLTNVRQDYGKAWHGQSRGIDAFSGADILNWGGMYIISNVNSDAALMDGHAWIRLESRNGESTTMSLWGNRGKQEFWMNLEINGGYGSAKKFSPITPSQYNLIINYNSNASNINWTPWNTCAGYSVGLWNYVNGDNLSATDYFWFTTPRRLAGSINTNP